MKQIISKLEDLPSGLVHLIYAVLALPTLFYLAQQVNIIATDAAARAEIQKANIQRLEHLERDYKEKINKLEQQVDYLRKRLLEKTTTKMPYNFNFAIENHLTQYDQPPSDIPPIWLPIQPLIAKHERRNHIRWL